MFFSDFFDINAEETIRKKKCSITLNINEENGIILLYPIAYYKKNKYTLNGRYKKTLKNKNTDYILQSSQLINKITSKDKKAFRYERIIENKKVKFYGLNRGIYFIRQSKTQDGYYSIKPFIVSIPQKNSDGTKCYDITGNPKVERVNSKESSNYKSKTKDNGNKLKSQKRKNQSVSTKVQVNTEDNTDVLYMEVIFVISLLILWVYIRLKK